MSQFKTVFDFLKAVPEGLRHEEIYLETVKKAADDPRARLMIDLVEWEKSTVGIGEAHILRDLECVENFTMDKFDSKFLVDSGSIAKAEGKNVGKGSLSHDKEQSENFLLANTIDLVPTCGSILQPGGRTVQLADNQGDFRKVMSALNGASPSQLIGSAISLVGEKLTTKQDMRYFFLKAYLLLCNYNLATTSRREKVQLLNIAGTTAFGCSGSHILTQMVAHRIVVDVSHFTSAELNIIVEVASEYPKRRYDVQTIYGGLRLAADDLVFISAGSNVNISRAIGFGSPEELWHHIVSIALKFNALEDLREVIRDFRGIPGLLRDVSRVTKHNSFMVNYPRSYSVHLAVAYYGTTRNSIKRNSNYYATSKSLVVDLMLSNMMVMSCFNLIEELGFRSEIGCPSKSPATDTYFHSNLRNRGLKSEDESENELLQEWRAIRATPVMVSFNGKLKDYVAQLAATIENGDTSSLRPQLLYALPYSKYRNTTWAMIRGWRKYDFNFVDQAPNRVNNNLLTNAYTWVMGVTNAPPRIGLNALGRTFIELPQWEGMKFTQLADGKYTIGLVRHVIKGGMEPRMDSWGLGPNVFYSSHFPGTRCTIVFDKQGQARIEIERVRLGQGSLATIDAAVLAEQGTEVVGTSFGGSALSNVPPPASVSFRRVRDILGNTDKENTPPAAPARSDNSTFTQLGTGRASTGFASRGGANGGRGRGFGRGVSESPEGVSGLGGQDRRGTVSTGRVDPRAPPVRPGSVERTDAPTVGRNSAPPQVGRGSGEGGVPGGDARNVPQETPATNARNSTSLPETTGNASRSDGRSGSQPRQGDQTEHTVSGSETQRDPATVEIVDKPLIEVILPEYNDEVFPDVMVGRTIEGQEVEFQLAPNSERLPDTFRGHILQTRGDGLCGLHGVLQDLRMRGMIPQDVDQRTVESLATVFPEGRNMYESSLGYWMMQNGMGLYVILGDEAQPVVYQYVPPRSVHNVVLYHKNFHYSTFIPDPRGPHAFQDAEFYEVWRYEHPVYNERLDNVFGGPAFPLWRQRMGNRNNNRRHRRPGNGGRGGNGDSRPGFNDPPIRN